MFWSAISATASMTTSSGIVFTAPTLNPGNATSISYDSSDTDVATIDASGAVTIIGAGTTTISAIFEGNSNYAPQTVTYTLTVTDDRETVATPTFNPASGVVDANTTVAISTQTSGATIHYTTDGSNPTTSSPVYSAPIVITSAITINAIAVKENYKDSGIATATYSIRGQSVNVWEDDFSNCHSYEGFTTLSGSTTGFTGNYSNFGNTYKMMGAIRVGKASAPGSITTPVLANITGSSANLTITFKAAGWNGKEAKLTLSANIGSVTEGQTTIQSESSMSNNNRSMTGTVYTFHITGANSTTKITFKTTCSIGIDDLVVTQTN
ncbi:MAG: chitobiase/beta-hexosaminidase C-terminal domain-containing protein [Bacteroidales bacterium]|nr:chitobiase/beta-hexosaminidase C-terminal domain-containing protein [Bacteroidales bacterium]